MKKWRFTLGLCLFAAAAVAQSVPVNLSAVPDSLKKGAAVIVHSQNINLEVEDMDEAKLKVQKIFTVLNESGKDALLFNEYTTKFINLTDVEIKVFDHQGKQVAKHKKRDMNTVAVGEGLVEEGYVTYYRVQAPAYPITLEVTYEQRFKGTLFLPAYRFIERKEAVLQSSFTAKVPADLKLRYKARQCNLAPAVTQDNKSTLYKWSVSNLKAIDDEEGSVSYRDRFPSVSFVCEQFSHYGYRGDFSSWKSFGAWLNGLYEGLDVLSPERQQFFQQLVSNAPNDREKVRRIYQYLQENFRYVSIQLGIGGLKPFSAAFTDSKKYGDCKALSNYMRAALKAVGIKSYVGVINAGHNEEPVDAAFPANGFNHMILCVPAKDSIWLECTSQTAAFAELGTFTENRNALLITEEGGVLVPTPRSQAATNSITTRNTVKIDSDLSALTETTITTKGAFAELMANITKSTKDEQKQILVFYLGYKQPEEFMWQSQEAASEHQTLMKMFVSKLHEFNAGSKYFFPARLQKTTSVRLPVADNRKLDYFFSYPFVKKDTTVMIFPAGFNAEVLPAEKKLETAYGSYQAKTWYNASEKAVYTATTLVLKQHRIPAADYGKVKAFFDEVAQEDAQKIVMKKGDVPAAEKKAF